jgi:hypothetical protein
MDKGMTALAELESGDMRGDKKVVSVSLVSLGAIDEREVV